MAGECSTRVSEGNDGAIRHHSDVERTVVAGSSILPHSQEGSFRIEFRDKCVAIAIRYLTR